MKGRLGSPESPSQQPGGEEDLEVMQDGGIVCAAWPSTERCSKDHALSNRPLGSDQATHASPRQDCALVVLMEKKSMETVVHPRASSTNGK